MAFGGLVDDRMDCRIGCAACCVLLKIDEPYQGYPNGKPAGERCTNLTDDNRCGIYEERPISCSSFPARRMVCGDTNEEAYANLGGAPC